MTDNELKELLRNSTSIFGLAGEINMFLQLHAKQNKDGEYATKDARNLSRTEWLCRYAPRHLTVPDSEWNRGKYNGDQEAKDWHADILRKIATFLPNNKVDR